MFVHVHLLLGHQVTAKAKGVRLRRVPCEHCGEEYVYQLRRAAQGSAYAFLHLRTAAKKLQAQAAANTNLQKHLDHGEDPVPCPHCGHLQSAMLRAQRKKSLRRVGWASLILSPLYVSGAIAFACLGANPPDWALPVCLIAVTIGVWNSGWLAWILLRDPNRSAHRRTREALGPRCRALPAHEFDALLEGSASENDDFAL